MARVGGAAGTGAATVVGAMAVVRVYVAMVVAKEEEAKEEVGSVAVWACVGVCVWACVGVCGRAWACVGVRA